MPEGRLTLRCESSSTCNRRLWVRKVSNFSQRHALALPTATFTETCVLCERSLPKSPKMIRVNPHLPFPMIFFLEICWAMLLCIKIGRPDPDPDDISSRSSLIVEGWLAGGSRSDRDFPEKEVTATPFSLPPYDVTPALDRGTPELRLSFLKPTNLLRLDLSFSLQRRRMRMRMVTAWGPLM